MWIIGVDYHPSVQQIAFVNADTGDCGEPRLSHSDGEAEKFYRELKAAGYKVRVGMEATDMPAGSSGCSRNWGSNCGSEIRRGWGSPKGDALVRALAQMPVQRCGGSCDQGISGNQKPSATQASTMGTQRVAQAKLH